MAKKRSTEGNINTVCPLAGRSVGVMIIALLGWLLPLFSPGFSSTSARWKSAEADTDHSLVSTATREGRLAVFDDLWQTVADRYYSANFHGVDWLAQRSLFRPLAAAAPGLVSCICSCVACWRCYRTPTLQSTLPMRNSTGSTRGLSVSVSFVARGRRAADCVFRRARVRGAARRHSSG